MHRRQKTIVVVLVYLREFSNLANLVIFYAMTFFKLL
jgi:hypothetical protein